MTSMDCERTQSEENSSSTSRSRDCTNESYSDIRPRATLTGADHFVDEGTSESERICPNTNLENANAMWSMTINDNQQFRKESDNTRTNRRLTFISESQTRRNERAKNKFQYMIHRERSERWTLLEGLEIYTALFALFFAIIVISIGTFIHNRFEQKEYDKYVQKASSLESQLMGVDMNIVNDYCDSRKITDQSFTYFHSIVFALHIATIGSSKHLLLDGTRAFAIFYIAICGPILIAASYMITTYCQTWAYWVYCKVCARPYKSVLDMRDMEKCMFCVNYWGFLLLAFTVYWWMREMKGLFHAFYEVFMFLTLIDATYIDEYNWVDMIALALAFFNGVGTYITILDFVVHYLEHLHLHSTRWVVDKVQGKIQKKDQKVDDHLSAWTKEHSFGDNSYFDESNKRQSTKVKTSDAKIINTLQELHSKYKTGELRVSYNDDYEDITKIVKLN